MNFISFLAEAKKKSFWSTQRVICIRGKVFPLVCLKMLFDMLRQKDIVSIVPLKAEGKLELWKTLRQSFLGEYSFYWLANISEAYPRHKPDMIELLSLYKGPHSIICFMPADKKISVSAQKRMYMVDVPDTFSSQDMQKLLSFFGKGLSKERVDFLKDVLSSVTHLDDMCALIRYVSVTNVRLLSSLREFFYKVISPEQSLFALSDAFFKKQEKKFFALWHACNDDYSVPFWVYYWSDQLWRAYHVVTFLKKNDFNAAKKMSFRLPHAFIKYDWKKHSLKTLQRAHAMVYEIDFACKTGSTFCAFDLLYNAYFLNKLSE